MVQERPFGVGREGEGKACETGADNDNVLRDRDSHVFGL